MVHSALTTPATDWPRWSAPAQRQRDHLRGGRHATDVAVAIASATLVVLAGCGRRGPGAQATAPEPAPAEAVDYRHVVDVVDSAWALRLDPTPIRSERGTALVAFTITDCGTGQVDGEVVFTRYAAPATAAGALRAAPVTGVVLSYQVGRWSMELLGCSAHTAITFDENIGTMSGLALFANPGNLGVRSAAVARA